MSLEIIKKLRELTGAGMMDVKEALTEAGNDEEKAIEILRKKGQKMAAKRAERSTSEGVIAVAEGQNKIAFAKLACETDFVALNQDFITAAQDFAKRALEISADELKAEAEVKIKDELIVKIGENIQFAGSAVLAGQILGYYLHSNKKVAAAVVLKNGSVEVAREVAMHAAAMKPQYLKPEDVPAAVIAKEKEIYTEQLKNEGKPEAMLENILKGKINKFYSEVCLTKQLFIKDDKKTIEQFLADNQAEVESFIVSVL